MKHLALYLGMAVIAFRVGYLLPDVIENHSGYTLEFTGLSMLLVILFMLGRPR